MQGGNDHIEGPRHSGRARALGWGAAGLSSALLLIGGSLAALDREVFTHGDWQRFTGDAPDRSVVLAPAPRTQDSLAGRASERPPAIASAPAPVLRGTGGTAAPASTAPAPARPARGGAERAPGRSAGNGVGAELDDPAASAGEAPAERFTASGDTDGDGLSDRTELRLGTSLTSGDTDGDHLPDGWEARNALDPTDEADAAVDVDGDGLLNRTEFRVRSNPRVLDTDGNGTSDGEDDTDGDTVPNGVEQGVPGSDPASADSDGDGTSDGAEDADGDGVPTGSEVELGLDPAAGDSDGDGTTDGQADTDGDGASNADEVASGKDPAVADPKPPAPETPGPQTPAPETPAPETQAPETRAPEAPAPDAADTPDAQPEADPAP